MKRIKANIAGIQPGDSRRTWVTVGLISWAGLEEEFSPTPVFAQGDAPIAVGDKVTDREGYPGKWEVVALQNDGGLIISIAQSTVLYAVIQPEPEPEE